MGRYNCFNGCFMRIFKLSTIFLGVVLLVFGCSGPQPSPMNSAPQANNTASPTPQPSIDEMASFRKIYKVDCMRCHMENGEGGPVDIDGTKIKVPSFKRPSVIKDPDSELIEQIAEGGDDMPSFKSKLSADEIQGLVKFIRKEFQGK